METWFVCLVIVLPLLAMPIAALYLIVRFVVRSIQGVAEDSR